MTIDYDTKCFVCDGTAGTARSRMARDANGDAVLVERCVARVHDEFVPVAHRDFVNRAKRAMGRRRA